MLVLTGPIRACDCRGDPHWLSIAEGTRGDPVKDKRLSAGGRGSCRWR